MTELKPCPFRPCKSKPVLIGDTVLCPDCNGHAPLKVWNERVEPDVDEVIAVQLVMASGEHVVLPAAGDQEKFDRTLKRMLGVDETDINGVAPEPAKKATVEDMQAEDPAGEVGPRIPLKNIPENIPEPSTAPDAGVETSGRAPSGSGDPDTCGGPESNLVADIKAWMEERELSRYAAAKLIGISDSNLMYIVQGRTKNPAPKTIKKIRAAIAADSPNAQEPPSAKEKAATKASGPSAAPQVAPKSRQKANGKPLRALVTEWMESEKLNFKQASNVLGIGVPALTGITSGGKPRPETIEKLATVVPGVEAPAA